MFWPDSLVFFYTNQAARNWIGLPEAEIFKMTPTDLQRGPPVENFRMGLAPMLRGETNHVNFIRKLDVGDGVFKTIEFEIEHVQPEGERPRVLVVLRDVTAREDATENARQLAASLDLTKNEVYIFWPDSFEMLYLNLAARARTGWTVDECRGKKTSDHISEGQQAALRERCATLINGPARELTYQVVDRHGVPLEIQLHLVEPKGEKPRFISVYRDISDEKQAEKAKAQFISTVSHELQTPLTSIRGAVELFLAGAGGELTAKQKSLLTIAHRNSDRLAALINDLLDIEKIETGKMDFAMRDVDLSELVRNAVANNETYRKKFGVSCVVPEIESPALVRGNMDRLMQVMDHLLSNAAKFSIPGGKIEISVSKHGAHRRISVRDYGNGISKAVQATLFKQFTQGDSSDARAKGGTGLGLSIAKAIVEKHGGNIGFTSEVGVGSTFFVDLPNLTPDFEPAA